LVIIITGKPGSGKSSLLNDLILDPEFNKYASSGFIAKGIFQQDGTKDFILSEIPGGSEIHLASRHPNPSYINHGIYYFNPSAIKSGENILRVAIQKKSHVIIVDEIGPAELNHNIWYNPLLFILETFQGTLILTVRKSLLKQVVEKFHIKNYIVYEIISCPADTIRKQILNQLPLRFP